MAIYHHTTRMIGRGSSGSPVRALAYIAACKLSDQLTGERFNFGKKLAEEVQILLPENAPVWAKEIKKLVSEDKEQGLQALSDIVNGAEKRVNAQVYREVEFSLPRELTFEQNKALAQEYVQDQFCSLGMLAIQSFHVEKNEKTGELNPHCHTFLLTRELDEEGLSPKKNRDWNNRELHAVWREQWAQYASFHLKLHGHDIILDHRSYKDQGLDIEPQLKLGRPSLEQEKRARNQSELQRQDDGGEKEGRSEKSLGFIEDTPVTKRGSELRAIQLRNLYRIMRRPEVVFDIVTRHHATFMWGDVQKVLGRYVDEVALFQRLDARLRGSKELLLLTPEGGKSQEGLGGDQAIYTTRSMLKGENELVETAESLAGQATHRVSDVALENVIQKLRQGFQDEGHSLSEGQEQAIRHLVGEGQLKCLVGFAGAGKTTALSACREIWEEAGYRVYGLAPTGRAAQTLEGSGLQATTLHRFLKDFEGGRSQYSAESTLVLDEAGMVDVGRFKAFLGAVQSLGVKCVVVGDSGQLQPVEAGPAFRLVTTRIGVARLEEVVRQQVDWQRTATVLFGRQEAAQASQAYQDRGHVHLIDEKIPEGNEKEDVVRRYEIAARTSGLIFRNIKQEMETQFSREQLSGEKEMQGDSGAHGMELSDSSDVRQHKDYGLFLEWREIQKEAASEILDNADGYRGLLEARGINPLEMARLFVDRRQERGGQYREASELLKAKGLDHLVGREKGEAVDVRVAAKEALIEDWKSSYEEDLRKSVHTSVLIMAYSNRDVRDLNHRVRESLKESGVLGEKEFTYTISREVEDDFWKITRLNETRDFSVGDRIVFTRNDQGLGVKNGSLGTIVALYHNKVEVELDSGKGEKLSFAPSLFPFFDQGWAVTIHKSQGTTVDRSFLLASHEMTQNLSYVAMTRHREDVQVYGSSLDFWRSEKVAEVLSKSGEKLGAADYLDSDSLAKLMVDDDKFLSQFFTRISDELQAMGAVSKRAFREVAAHFLGRAVREREFDERMFMPRETVREEERAQEILGKSSGREFSREELSRQDLTSQEEFRCDTHMQGIHEPLEATREVEKDALSQLRESLEFQKERVNHTAQDVVEDFKHPAFKRADHYRRVFEEGLKRYGEEKAVEYWQSKRDEFFKLYEQKIERVKTILASPLLSYMSKESRDLAYKSAFEDPDKALKFFGELKESKHMEQEAKEKQEMVRESSLSPSFSKDRSAPLERDHYDQGERISKAHAAYFRFKDVKDWLRQTPDSPSLHKELRKAGMEVFKDKEVFAHIQSIDSKAAQEIEKIAQAQERERIRTLEIAKEHDRGGYSL